MKKTNHHRPKGKMGKMSVTLIKLDPQLQVRAAGTDPEQVAQIAEAVKARVPLPRIRVCTVMSEERDADNRPLEPTHYLVGGFNRLEGFKKAGRENVPVEVFHGDRRYAAYLAAIENREHTALRRTTPPDSTGPNMPWDDLDATYGRLTRYIDRIATEYEQKATPDYKVCRKLCNHLYKKLMSWKQKLTK